ncbi:MAG: signal peptidase II [Planctomycetota bacterium]|nr:signal peptidase II [Planctomycetota bacterium]
MAEQAIEPQATPEAQAAIEPRATSAQIGVRFAIVAFLIALDLWSKSAVFEWLQSRPPPEGMAYDTHGHHRYPIFGEWFGFMLSWNPGMAWGFDKLPTWLLVGGRCGAVAFLAWLVARSSPARRAMTAALVLILSGAAGNLYDNLFMEPRRQGARFGEVRDFLDVYFTGFNWHFPTFNVADACITVGAVFLIGASFLAPKAHADAQRR